MFPYNRSVPQAVQYSSKERKYLCFLRIRHNRRTDILLITVGVLTVGIVLRESPTGIFPEKTNRMNNGNISV